MKNFWRIVNKVIKRADVILLVLDARFPDLSYNEEINDKAGETPIIYVLNKSDLADNRDLHRWKRKHGNTVFVSAKEHQGTSMLKKRILELGRKEKIRVAVVGYPNTGKSSIINALKGRKSAKTSARSGYTKGEQYIKVNPRIFVSDTPGVLPYLEKDRVKHALIGAEDFTRVEDPDLIAMELINQKPQLLCSFYGVKGKGPEQILEAIAEKYQKLKKGGVLDLDATAKMILKDWQRGKITRNP